MRNKRIALPVSSLAVFSLFKRLSRVAVVCAVHTNAAVTAATSSINGLFIEKQYSFNIAQINADIPISNLPFFHDFFFLHKYPVFQG